MPGNDAFTINAGTQHVSLTDEHDVVFEVINNLGKKVALATSYLEIKKGDALLEDVSWIFITKNQERRDLAADGHYEITVHVGKPDEPIRETLHMRLVVKGDDADTDSGDSVWIPLLPDEEIDEKPDDSRPWWLYALIAGGGLVVLTAIVLLLVYLFGRPGVGEKCSPDALLTPCKSGLQCGLATRICVKETPALSDFCDPAGPACPEGNSCARGSDGYRCVALVAQGASCGAGTPPCAPGLICGPSVKRCIPEEPGQGQLCDPSASRCEFPFVCRSVGGQHACVLLIEEGEECEPKGVPCQQGLQCSKRLKSCIKKDPVIGDLCDPSASRCPQNAECTDIGAGPRCMAKQGGLGASCGDPGDGPCEADLYCSPTLRKCIKQRPGNMDLCDPGGGGTHCQPLACLSDGQVYTCQCQNNNQCGRGKGCLAGLCKKLCGRDVCKKGERCLSAPGTIPRCVHIVTGPIIDVVEPVGPVGPIGPVGPTGPLGPLEPGQ